MIALRREYINIPGFKGMDTYDNYNFSSWRDGFNTLETELGNLDFLLAEFNGINFNSQQGLLDEIESAMIALNLCKNDIDYELYAHIDRPLQKVFGEMTDQLATLDIKNIKTPNTIGLKGEEYVEYGAGMERVEFTLGELTLENFTGTASVMQNGTYREQSVAGFADLMEMQYNNYKASGYLEGVDTLEDYLNMMAPHEFEFSQDTKAWKKIAHSALEVLVIPLFWEAVTGKELITGDLLTDREQTGKAVEGVISGIGLGFGIANTNVDDLVGKKVINAYIATGVKEMSQDAAMNILYTSLDEAGCKEMANVLMYAPLAEMGIKAAGSGFGKVADLINQKNYKGQYDDALEWLTDVSKKSDEVLGVNESVGNIIKRVESGEIQLISISQKGNYGEMKMDLYFESQGYKRISLNRVTDIDAPMHQGIDGVYYNQNGHPPYIIGEAKFGKSNLRNTRDGMQMSDTWINGSDRLVNAVGKNVADEILLEGYGKTLVNVATDGIISITYLE